MSCPLWTEPAGPAGRPAPAPHASRRWPCSPARGGDRYAAPAPPCPTPDRGPATARPLTSGHPGDRTVRQPSLLKKRGGPPMLRPRILRLIRSLCSPPPKPGSGSAQAASRLVGTIAATAAILTVGGALATSAFANDNRGSALPAHVFS